jgi:hypothetical protein
VAIDVYATVAELNVQLGLHDAIDDEIAEACLLAVSRSVDDYCGRRFWQDSAVQTRRYRVDDPYLAWVDDISTTDGLVIATGDGDGTFATTWASTDYELEPYNANAFQAEDRTSAAHAWWRIAAVDRYTFLVSERRRTLQVTAKFGWSAVPPAVKRAALIKAARLFKRKDAPFGALGFDTDGIRISRWEDPDVVLLLEPLRRVGMAAV